MCVGLTFHAIDGDIQEHGEGTSDVGIIYISKLLL